MRRIKRVGSALPIRAKRRKENDFKKIIKKTFSAEVIFYVERLFRKYNLISRLKGKYIQKMQWHGCSIPIAKYFISNEFKIKNISRYNTSKTKILLAESRSSIADPIVVPSQFVKRFLPSQQDIVFPPKKLYSIRNAIITGGTNMIQSDGTLICHDLYDFKNDYTSEEMHGRLYFNKTFDKARVRNAFARKVPFLETAAVFTDSHSQNYAHWLTEVLPRINLFSDIREYDSTSIVVDEKLHKNILESLFLLAGEDRKIVFLGTGRGIAVRNALVVSPSSYTPFGNRGLNSKNPSILNSSIFCSTSIALCVNKIKNKIKNNDSAIKYPPKIYLKRTLRARGLINAKEVEKELTSRGYVAIEPDSLSFSEQVALFNSVTHCIAPTGAGLANGIFCKPGTKVGIIFNMAKGAAYSYWTNMLSPIGVKIYYVASPTEGWLHADYESPIQAVRQLINEME